MKQVIYVSLITLLTLTACSKGGGSSSAKPQITVTTVAGNGTNGFADGTGASAQFNTPAAIAIDPGTGNLYITDQNNNRIREVTPEGAVTTIAGISPGDIDGSGTGAEFNNPDGIAIDGSGNVYITDLLNNAIRKSNKAGTVVTLAGKSEGLKDGTGLNAQFFYPYGIALDHAGNMYVSDGYNQRIRMVTPAGVVTTIAGSGQTGPGNGGFSNGPAATALFESPFGIAVDASGNIFVADQGNNLIREISAAGIVSTVAGDGSTGFADGAAANAEFAAPEGIALDAQGHLFVADWGNNRIREIANGVVTTIAGNTASGYQDGPGATALFNGPTGVVVDASGNLYVTDGSNGSIRKITFH